jgi:hypothetical protein
MDIPFFIMQRLAENVLLKRDIPKDDKIYLEDIEYDENSDGFALFSKSIQAQSGS